MYRTHQMQREKADRTGMGKNYDPLSLVFLKDPFKFVGDPPKELFITLAVRDDVIDVAVDQSIIITGKAFFRFVEGQALEYPDVPFSKRGRGLRASARHAGSGK